MISPPIKIFSAVLVFFLLAACADGQQWRHSTRTKYDFAIDDRECQQLALAKAREDSLVEQPILTSYFIAHSSCLSSRGWRPLETVGYKPKPIRIDSDDTRIRFSAADFDLTLNGRYDILKKQEAAFLLEQDGTYIFPQFQLDYPQKLVRIQPILSAKAVYFDDYRKENLSASFYYQEADGKLVFACTAYLFINDNSRVVLSLSKTFFDMPPDFLKLPPEDFAKLTACQQDWQKLLSDLARQF